MNYFRYLFSDKKAMIYWIWLSVVLVIYSIIRIITYPNDITGFLLVLILLVIFIGLYTSGFVNYKIQQKFLKTFSNIIIEGSIHQQNVQIFLDSFAMKTFKGNYDAQINIKPRLDKFITFCIDDNIGILGQTYEFGIFRCHIKPILISLKGNDLVNKYKYAKTPQVSNIVNKGNDLEIKFKSSISGINMIRLIDWNEKSPDTAGRDLQPRFY